jgi:hypothetical protein
LSQSAEAVVRGFCDAWERRDLESVLGMLAPDLAYQPTNRSSECRAVSMAARQARIRPATDVEQAAVLLTRTLARGDRLGFWLLVRQ